MMILTIVKSFIFNNIKSVKLILAGFLLLIMIAVTSYGIYIYKSYNTLKDRYSNSLNNISALEDINSNNSKEKIALVYTIDQLNNSKDSVIIKANELRKKLQIKDNQLKSLISNRIDINDTIVKELSIGDSCRFDIMLSPNSQTNIRISYDGDSITCIPNIINDMNIFIYIDRVYVNKYKNGWCRFWNFDYKKNTLIKHKIEHSNPLISSSNTRVVQVENN